MTAAHCLDHRLISENSSISEPISVKNYMKIIVGMENPGLNCSKKEDVTYYIKDYFIHPKFDFPYFDVAIIELESNINFTKGIAPVCLSSASPSDLEYRAVSLFGWGARNYEGIPSKVLLGTRQLAVTSVENCKSKIDFFTFGDPLYESVFNRTNWLKTNPSDQEISMEGIICVADQDPNGWTGSCGGDSGSAVVQRAFGSDGSRKYEQVGIVSGGRCSYRDTPRVLAHIGHEDVLEFINTISKFTRYQ